MTLHEWRIRARITNWGGRSSKRRQRALQVMGNAVEAALGMGVTDKKELLKRVDAAYPFGARKNYPYTCWLEERRIFIDSFDETPSQEEFDACMIAGDLVELGRAAEAKTLLDEQAPARHERPCPVCGVRKGRPCREPEPFALGILDRFKERLVPHVARIQPEEGTV